ncbi:MAG TPA: hypothetical protein VMW41_05650 [Candidatus Bathyarchaeia archaeon]|nr:hypothetical protein [Candidatus Bathyarchaeia archaeon]
MPRDFRKKSLGLLLSFSLLSLVIFPSQVKAWGGDIHTYLCPGSFDCNIADDRQFKTANKWDDWGHVCLDNQPDCTARLGARYFLKRYYQEGKADWQLLAAAAHLYQDAVCPDHWYPMREYFGRIIVPFAPAWVTKIEGKVSTNMSYRPQPGDTRDNWNIPVIWHGQKIDVNKAYLDDTKESLKIFVSQEPSESLVDLKKQIDTKMTITLIRSYKEIAYLVSLIILPIWLYALWDFKKKGRKGDFLITSLIVVILIVYFILLKIFW